MGLVGYESTGWFSRKLVMRVSTVERVEDGTVYAQMPVSRKGDSGLPAYAVVNGNYLLSGVTGVWSSTYEGFEMQHMSNVSVAGNATVEVRGNETDSHFQKEVLKTTQLGLRTEGAGHTGKTGSYTTVGGHCGSGKTRNIIGSYIRDNHGMYQKIFVAAPTRVVAREIYSALRATPCQV